jgi:hypothetical protein
MERVTSGLNTTMRTAYERSLSMKRGRSRMKMVVQKHTQLVGALTVVAGKKMSVDFFWGNGDANVWKLFPWQILPI